MMARRLDSYLREHKSVFLDDGKKVGILFEESCRDFGLKYFNLAYISFLHKSTISSNQYEHHINLTDRCSILDELQPLHTDDWYQINQNLLKAVAGINVPL